MQVTEESIALACNLPTDGEKWFKNKLIEIYFEFL
jgi:hypothetical protein